MFQSADFAASLAAQRSRDLQDAAANARRVREARRARPPARRRTAYRLLHSTSTRGAHLPVPTPST
jgi:hypothetical protein